MLQLSTDVFANCSSSFLISTTSSVLTPLHLNPQTLFRSSSSKEVRFRRRRWRGSSRATFFSSHFRCTVAVLFRRCVSFLPTERSLSVSDLFFLVSQALEYVLVDQQIRLVNELDGHVLKCARDAQSNHVVQVRPPLPPPLSLRLRS
jgi:hypothetical protein